MYIVWYAVDNENTIAFKHVNPNGGFRWLSLR